MTNEATQTKPKYKIMPNLIPIPSDTLIFRRRWAGAKGNDRLWQIRRQLAHDYKIARCSGKDSK